MASCVHNADHTISRDDILLNLLVVDLVCGRAFNLTSSKKFFAIDDGIFNMRNKIFRQNDV